MSSSGWPKARATRNTETAFRSFPSTLRIARGRGRPTNLSRLRPGAAHALPGSSPIPIALHREGQCRWPIGDGPFAYCGCATEERLADGQSAKAHRPNSNYCPAHAALGRPADGSPATVSVLSLRDLERIAR